MADAIRVLIVDDHWVVREGLRMILSLYPDIQVVGEAENGLRAIELVEEVHPAVILMDLRMPVLDGLTAISKIKAKWPEVAIVILTTYSEDDLMISGLQAGAQGFLLKDTHRDMLIETIQAASRGETLLQRDTVNRLISKLEATPRRSTRSYLKQSVDRRSQGLLSQREAEILKLVATGARNKEIAFELRISQSTVKAHLDSIFNKLGVDSRTAAVCIASQQELFVE